MRSALGLAALVALLAPVAAADTIGVEPVPPLRPLESVVFVAFRVRAECEPTIPGAPPPQVRVAVASKPSWLNVVVTPAEFAVGCPTGETTLEGRLGLSATEMAPALSPATFGLAVSRTGSTLPQNRTATASVPVQATFFSILDLDLGVAVFEMAPGTSRAVDVDVTNAGNGPTRVAFALENVSDGLFVRLPPDFVVGARPTGDARVRETVRFVVTAREEEGVVNRVGVVNVRASGAYSADPSLAGDSAAFAWVVTVKQFEAPAPPLALALALALALVTARPRTRRRCPCRCSR